MLVQTEDGHLFTVLPDGTERVVLSEPPELLSARQATWSPDASRVAWVAIDGRTAPAMSVVVTAKADGSQQALAVTSAPAFFLNWDPTGSRVAYLGPGPDGIELGVVDHVVGGSVATALEGGQPFYFSWAPEGDRMLSRIGLDVLTYVSVDGTSSPLADRGGDFRAPQWDAQRDRLLYATTNATGQRLVLAAPGGGDRREILRFEGFIEFGLNSTGDRVAYQVISLDDGDSEGAGRSSAIDSTGAPAAVTDGLAILDLASGRSNLIANEVVMAFFWSPDGRSLLYLMLEERSGEVGVRWRIWDGERNTLLAFFFPTEIFVRDYLPFFDQYAQTLTPWSPDGAEIAFAARGADGANRIWVQRADGSTPPSAISSGVFASWSPR